MYYRLKAPWAFRGWKRTPYAIAAQSGRQSIEKPMFYSKEPFLDLLYCDGEENIDISDFSDAGRQELEKLMEQGIIEKSSERMQPLEDWQRYQVFPSRYVVSVHWSITGKCNFRCRHCLVSAPTAKHPQLPLKDCIRIMDEMERCGIRTVDITGGEPLVRRDFEEIVRELTSRKIAIRVLFSNASLLTKEVLDMLQRHHQNPLFQLSFDGLGFHDWLRGVPGAEKQADRAFRLLQSCGAEFIVGMCIHKKNKDCLRDTVNYLADLGVGTVRVNAPQSLGMWKEYQDSYALTTDEVWEAYRDYLPYYFQDHMPVTVELDGFFRCIKGSTNYAIPYLADGPADQNWSKVPYCENIRKNVYIGADGRIAPCMGFTETALNEKFPNVLEEHLGDITLKGFYFDTVQANLADYLERNPECAACENWAQCLGGCMLQGITEEGDYLVPDPAKCYFYRHIGEAAVREAADSAIRLAGLNS